MPAPRQRLAKLTRPRIRGAVARERLFRLLDEAREHKPAICVAGPPGAGKTTLVTSWLEVRGLDGIWYQVDQGDGDLATFFYYLGESAKAFIRKGQRPLPLLTPEYLQDVERFTRRFFRELFGRLPDGATVVLDNYQEVPPEHTFHRVISLAVDEAPTGVTLIVVSRQDPPHCYARLIANDNVAFVNWTALKLTAAEARKLVLARSQAIEDEDLQWLHARSEGWAAGLVLVLERLGEQTSPGCVASSESLRGVFDYFAGELFENCEPAIQHVLVRLSYLPRMTAASAVALTGTPRAAALLEEYYRRHLFTDRRGTPERVYQFHALFSAFLRNRASLILSKDEQVGVALAAARIACEHGDTDEAFSLYLQSGHTERAAEVVILEANRLLAQGRWVTVVNRITALPSALVDNHAWLLYWLGTAKTPIDPTVARSYLESSYALAARDGDHACRVQAIAGIIQTYMLEYKQFRPLDPWIEALQEALRNGHSFSGPDAELRVRSALLAALSFRKPGDPMLEECAEKVFDLVESSADATLRTLSAAYLAYCARTGPISVALRAQPLLQRLIRQPGLSALTVGWGWWAIAYVHLISGNADACRRAVAEAHRIGRDEALAPVSRFAAAIGAHIEMDNSNLVAAQAWADRLEEVIIPGLAYDRALSNTIKAMLAVIGGDPASASALAREAVDLFDMVGVHQLRCLTRAQLAWPLVMQGALDAAESFAQEALQLALAARAEWVELEARFALAAIALEGGDTRAIEARLKAAFALLHKTRYVPTLSKFRGWAAKLCAAALRRGIETSNARSLVRQLELRAPSVDIEQWPWRIRVFTLGRSRIEVNDAPLGFSRKTPRKLISLIKALVAFGGQDVPIERLVDTLWPELEGDSASDACWLALNRVRKLLGTADAVLLAGGRVSLNRELVWTDAGHFEHIASPAAREAPSAMDIEQALAIYRGPFLEEERDSPWATPTRERLTAKFIRLLERHALQLEGEERLAEAIALYLRALDVEPAAEPLYQGLMRCYCSQGRSAEALNAYDQLRSVLLVTSGRRPSVATEALARTQGMER